ncbi:protein transport protein S31, partial [Coemansia sp. RSA 1933]
MVYQYVERTAIPAWGPQQADAPLVATGTVAGAMDASFSNMSELEIFKVAGDEDGPLKALGKVEAAARFQRLAWSGGKLDEAHVQGVLAGGLENGDVAFWNPTTIIDGGAADAALLHSSSAHTGAVGGLEFNPFQASLMASGSANGEVFIWDVVNEYKSYSPGPRSQRLDNITDLAWNNQVQHILATASNTGAVVVWDLRTRREAISFASPGVIGGGSMGGSGRAGISATEWNPASPTQLVTASSDDSNPVIMLWDLRNVNAPSQTFAGHNRGILSLSWCRKDAGLLLSSGKDNRTICWNPQTGDIVGELPPSNNWVYDVQWNQTNPNLLSGASFDGRISLYTLSREASEPLGANAASVSGTTDDPFAPQSTSAFSLALKRAPKWLARPCGAAFGFGGKLVHFGKQPVADGAATAAPYTPALVSITDFVSEPDMAQQAQQLEELLESDQAADLCSKRLDQSKGTDQERSWQVLQILFESDARDKLIRFLGFDKAELKARIEELLKNSKANAKTNDDEVADASQKKTDEAEDDENPFASSVDPEAEDLFAKSLETSPTKTTGEGEAPIAAAGPSATEEAAAADIRALRLAFSSSFSIYDKTKAVDSEDAEGLVTRAVLLGDIEGAVELCIEQELFADALILATCGSAELATRAQQAYFAKRAQQAPYIRLLHGIVTNDLSDIARNAALDEWDEVLALLCTYAQGDQFSALCEVLGRRLEETASQMDNAVLCYLASGNLDKVAAIWIAHHGSGEIGGRAHALHLLIEKVSVFRKAVQFIDPAVGETAQEGPAVFPLAPLYDCYVEYAQFLAAQGLHSIAAKYVARVPGTYRCFQPTGEDALAALRNRLAISEVTPWTVVQVTADGEAAAAAEALKQQQQQQQAQTQAQTQQRQYSTSNASSGYPPTSSNMPIAQHYGMPGTGGGGFQAAPVAYGVGGFAPAPAAATAPYAGMVAQGYAQQPVQSVFPPPPLNPASLPTGNTPPPAAPAQRRDDSAWNDPPMLNKPAKRAMGGANKPAAIVSPFPQGSNTPPPAAVAQYASARSPGPQQQQVPPPPRAGFVQSSRPPPMQPMQAQAVQPVQASMAFPTAQHMAVQQPGHPFQPIGQPMGQPMGQPGFVPQQMAPPGMAGAASPQGSRGQVVQASPV